MRTGTHQQISKLIKELKINDQKKACEYEEPPEEPKETMDALVEIGGPAVEALLELLRGRSKYSCLYAIKVLGKIGNHRTVRPIIDVFSSKDFNEAFDFEEDYDQPMLALQKIGLPALEKTIRYLAEAKEKGSVIDMWNAMRTIAGINDERSFMTLVNMLSHSRDEIQSIAAELLGEYGDKRAVQQLKKLLGNMDVKDVVAEAVRKLVPFHEYRKIIAPYAHEHLESYHRQINENLRDLEFAYEHPPRFEGDRTKELNAVALEHKVRKAVNNLLQKVAELGVYEGVISEDIYELLDEASSKLWKKQYMLKKKYEEQIDIIEGYIPGTISKDEKRSYKSLAPESMFEEHPKLKTLRAIIWEWLDREKFHVFSKNNKIFARKGKKAARKGSYVSIFKDYERPRTWGLVHLILWGAGWSKQEAEQFTESFWQFVNKTVIELVGKKKFRVKA